jgi:RecB family exonuclease
VPSEQSIRQLERKVRAIWQAIERACERDDFRPKQSRLCNWCAYQTYCPAFGGDPEAARQLALQLSADATHATSELTDGTAVALPLASDG